MDPQTGTQSGVHRRVQHGSSDPADQLLRTYVLDTSVLLSDPSSMFRFAEHAVVLPIVVISELEGKRNDPEIGYFARQALRRLDELRVQHERLDFPIAVGRGGTLRVELNHSNMSVLPSGLQMGDNDARILAVALNLQSEGAAVTVVSKDMPMRVKAASIGLAAEEYLAEQAPESGWTGMDDVTLGGDAMSELYDRERLFTDVVADIPVNTGLVVHSDRGETDGGGLHPHRHVLGHDGDRRALALQVERDGDRSRSSAATRTSSACTGARRSSGSRSTCCSTRRSASSRSEAGPAPASRRWRSARAWRRCWRSASTRRSWSSGRSTRWAARTSASCPATRPRR
jgi:predicted nucleic acid-binding protein